MVKKLLKNHSSVLTAVLVNAFFLTFILLLCGTYYEVSDDWFFAKNIAGGHYDYTFCSFFIQYLTGLVQKVIYPVNAFIVVQIALGFVALSTICYIFLETFKFKKGIFLVLILECLFAINIYSIVTFTKTAAFLLVAGGLMMLWSYHNKKHLGFWVYGIVLVLFGSFYRMKIFYSVLAIFFVAIAACILSTLEKIDFKSILAAIKKVLNVRTVSMVIVMFLVVFSYEIASREMIYSGEGMDYYKEYNSLRSSVVDFTLPDYNEEGIAELYNSIGISRNDYKMLKNWYLDDGGNADVETLTKVCELQKTAKDSFLRIVKKMLIAEWTAVLDLQPEGILIIAYIILSALILLLYKNKSFLFFGMITSMIVCLYTYLWYEGRCNYRAVFSIILSSVVCLLYCTRFLEYRDFLQKIKENKNRLFSNSLTAVCLAFIGVFLYCTTAIVPDKLPVSLPDGYPVLEEYILAPENEGKVFALSRKSYLVLRNAKKMRNPLVLDYEEDAFDRCVYFGNTYYAHPRYNELLASVGVDNLYTDIIDNENIYFVDRNDITMFIRYLNEHYDDEDTVFGYKTVKKMSPFAIYRIVSYDRAEIEKQQQAQAQSLS